MPIWIRPFRNVPAVSTTVAPRKLDTRLSDRTDDRATLEQKIVNGLLKQSTGWAGFRADRESLCDTGLVCLRTRRAHGGPFERFKIRN